LLDIYFVLLHLRISPAKKEKAKQIHQRGANYKCELTFISHILHLDSMYENQLLQYDQDETELNSMRNTLNSKKMDHIRNWKKGLSKDSGRIFSRMVADVYKTELEDLSEEHDIDDELNDAGVENGSSRLETAAGGDHPEPHSVASANEQNSQSRPVSSDLITEGTVDQQLQPKKRTFDWEVSDDEDDTLQFTLDMLKNAPINNFRTKYIDEDVDCFTEVLISEEMSSELILLFIFDFNFVNSVAAIFEQSRLFTFVSILVKIIFTTGTPSQLARICCLTPADTIKHIICIVGDMSLYGQIMLAINFSEKFFELETMTLLLPEMFRNDIPT
jgi:hypothetical protein